MINANELHLMIWHPELARDDGRVKGREGIEQDKPQAFLPYHMPCSTRVCQFIK